VTIDKSGISRSMYITGTDLKLTGRVETATDAILETQRVWSTLNRIVVMNMVEDYDPNSMPGFKSTP